MYSVCMHTFAIVTVILHQSSCDDWFLSLMVMCSKLFAISTFFFVKMNKTEHWTFQTLKVNCQIRKLTVWTNVLLWCGGGSGKIWFQPFLSRWRRRSRRKNSISPLITRYNLERSQIQTCGKRLPANFLPHGNWNSTQNSVSNIHLFKLLSFWR